MRAVTSCEFLISPSMCTVDLIDELYNGLTQLHSDIVSASFPPLIEDDAYEKLLESGRYPAEKLFAGNILEAGETIISANDVATLVNKILSGASCLSDLDFYWVPEWQDLEVHPNINGVSEGRKSEVINYFSTLAICNLLTTEHTCALHYPREFGTVAEVRGSMLQILPPDPRVPFNVAEVVQVYTAYKDYFSAVGEAHFLRDGMNEHDFKTAIFAGALRLRSEASLDFSDVEFDDFSFGADFFDSLRRNQAYYGDEYFDVVVTTLTYIVAGMVKNHIGPFRESENSTAQRKRGTSLAYRTHLTGKGLGLRLMFWKSPSGLVEFANVGSKFELKIS